MKLEKKLKIIEKKIDQAIKNKKFHLLNELFFKAGKLKYEIDKKKEIEFNHDELFI
jgi:hypothetical protein